MKQARDYRKYNVRLTSADWQRGSDRVINYVIQKHRNPPKDKLPRGHGGYNLEARKCSSSFKGFAEI